MSNIKLKTSRDIFLIRPPEGAAHRPVSPERIVIARNSADGGLSLALLQVIRDSGLPAPAGGVLISPWCDLTHSFPSTITIPILYASHSLVFVCLFDSIPIIRT